MTEEELNKIYVIGIGLRKFKRILKKIRKEHPDAPIFVTPNGYLTYISPVNQDIKFNVFATPVGLTFVVPLEEIENQKFKELQLCRSFVKAGMPKNSREDIEDKKWQWSFSVKTPTKERVSISLEYEYKVNHRSQCNIRCPDVDPEKLSIQLQFLDDLIPQSRISQVEDQKHSRTLQIAYSRSVLWAHAHSVHKVTGVFHPLVNAK